MQTKTQSLIEQLTSTFVGFLLSLLTWEFVVKPIWEIQTSFIENFQITILFTVVSILRGYALRRVFNTLHNKNNKEAHENKTDRDYREGSRG